jgi:hypothetical protein
MYDLYWYMFRSGLNHTFVLLKHCDIMSCHPSNLGIINQPAKWFFNWFLFQILFTIMVAMIAMYGLICNINLKSPIIRSLG